MVSETETLICRFLDESEIAAAHYQNKLSAIHNQLMDFVSSFDDRRHKKFPTET